MGSGLTRLDSDEGDAWLVNNIVLTEENNFP